MADMIQPQRTTISPRGYDTRRQMLAQQLQAIQPERGNDMASDLGAQLGSAINQIGQSYMLGSLDRQADAQRQQGNDLARQVLAARLAGQDIGPEAFDVIGNEWVDPGYQNMVGQLVADQYSPKTDELVQAVGDDGRLHWVPKSQAAGMQSALPEGPKAAPSRQIHRNGLLVDQELGPNGWIDVGQGPQFAPQQPREPGDQWEPYTDPVSGRTGQKSAKTGKIDWDPGNTVLTQTGTDANGQPIYEMTTIGGKNGAPKPPTADQEKSSQLYAVMAPELKIVEQTFDALADPVAQGISILPGSNAAQSADYQRAKKSLKTIVASYLYVTSGATANPGEIETQTNVLMPEFGDKPANLADKKQRIRTMVESVAQRAGQGVAPIDTTAGAPSGQSPIVAAPQSSNVVELDWQGNPVQ